MIPPLYKGRTVYILASGPSLHQLDGKDWLRGRACVAVNSSMFVGNYIDVLFFGDAKWYWWNKSAVDMFPGYKFSMNLERKGRQESIAGQSGITILSQDRKKAGLETKPDKLCFNGSSGACALNLAYHLGAARMVLLGFDMQQVGNDRNYIHHPIRGSLKYAGMIKRMKVLSQDLQAAGIPVFNATENSALPWFPRIPLKEALCKFPK